MSRQQITVYNDFNFSEMQEAATTIAKSKIFPAWDTSEKVLTLMLVARSEGVDPMTAMQRYDMIEGKLSKRPSAMMADFISAGGKIRWLNSDDKSAKAEFITPLGVKHVEEFSIQDAERAGLSKKTNWQKYPKSMLRARTISAGLRAVYPSATNLLYTPEETENFDDKPAIKESNKLNKIIQESKISYDIEPAHESETSFEEKIAELNPQKVVQFLKKINWISQQISELSEKRKQEILSKFDKFSECVNQEEI